MTVPRWGRITPSQGDMLMLAGNARFLIRYFSEATPETDEDRLAAMRLGRERMRKRTGQDYGYNLRLWHEVLLADAEDEWGYRHPYAWHGVHEEVERAMNDPDHQRLVEILEREV